MCWNWQVSILTWLIGLSAGTFMIKRANKYDITFGSLIIAYSSMQLWEAFMWWDQKCGNMNKFASMAAYLALWSHTLAIGIGLYIEQREVLPLVIGVCFMVVAIIQMFFTKWKCSKPQKGDGCNHIAWGFPHTYYVYVFTVCIAISLVCIRPMWKALVVSGLFLSSFLLSVLYAKEAAGSFWCWIAAFFSPVLIAINA